MTASGGRTLGRIRHTDLQDNGSSAPETGPIIAVLPTAAPDAATFMSRWRGAVVENGNPADHLSTVAREAARPMLTRASGARAALADGTLAVLDATEGRLTAAPAAIGAIEELLAAVPAQSAASGPVALSAARAGLRDRIVPLTLARGDAPTFTLEACHTLHDIIRFAHETAVLALFETGDSLLGGAVTKACLLGEGTPLAVMSSGVIPSARTEDRENFVPRSRNQVRNGRRSSQSVSAVPMSPTLRGSTSSTSARKPVTSACLGGR